jgi:hypothetical protein
MADGRKLSTKQGGKLLRVGDRITGREKLNAEDNLCVGTTD